MKRILHTLALAAVAALPFAMTSCEDHPWDEYDRWAWVDDYDNYRWNDNYDNQYDSQNNERLTQVQTLCNGWDGTMTYSEVGEDGTRTSSKFYCTMEFYQYGSSINSLSGNGTEYDYITDASGNITEDQTLRFSWYIDEYSGDIYIKYTNSGKIFVMDASSRNYGFRLGYEQGYNDDVFYGWMIGTNTDDVAYIDLQSINTGNAKANRVAAKKSMTTAGKATTRNNLITAPQQKLPKR